MQLAFAPFGGLLKIKEVTGTGPCLARITALFPVPHLKDEILSQMQLHKNDIFSYSQN